MDEQHVDVIIVGAGLSGIGAAYRLQEQCPGKTYAVLESREAVGGTWDLFRYPGIRSDSDMYTLSFPFKPWTNAKAIADGGDIRDYIDQAADEFGIRDHIRFGHRVVRASWSSDELAETVVDGRVDFAVVGVCADAPPPTQHGLTWRTVTTDPVFVLLPERHALAGRAEVELAELAGEDWAAIPVDGCFTGCFAAACARAGFTPRTLYEADAASCVDLVAAGLAVALCQPTREVAGLVTVPIADAPLRWNHLVGWHPEAASATFADEIVRLTSDAYAGLIVDSPVYSSWLRGRTGFGVVAAAPITSAV